MAEARIFYQDDCNLDLIETERRSLSLATAARDMLTH